MKISEREFLARCGIDRERLNVWIDDEWLIPSNLAGEFGFIDIDLARAQFIRDLQEDFGVNSQGVDIVLHLVDQLNGIRRTLTELRQLLNTQSE